MPNGLHMNLNLLRPTRVNLQRNQAVLLLVGLIPGLVRLACCQGEICKCGNLCVRWLPTITHSAIKINFITKVSHHIAVHADPFAYHLHMRVDTAMHKGNILRLLD